MRVLVLNYEFPPLGGGSGQANYHIFKEMADKEGLELVLVTSSADKHRVEQFASNITIHFLDIGKGGKNVQAQSMKDLLNYSRKAYAYMKPLLKKEKFDLIHAFFGIPCGAIARLFDLPYIVSLRGSDVPFHSPKYKWPDKLVFAHLSRNIWRKAAYVVANSEGLKEEAKLTNANQEVKIIYNGIDTETFKPGAAKSVPGGVIKLVSVGRLSKIKAYDNLIRALAGKKGFQLKLIGDGGEREALKAQAAAAGVTLELTGRLSRKEIIKELHRGDLFVLPSHSEGMSNALLEAMACGLPALVTDVGGSGELIQGNGTIVPPGSVEALGKALLDYAAAPERLVAEGLVSRERTLGMSWESVAEGYFKLYQSC